MEDRFIDQLALMLDNHRQVSVRNSRHAAYILIHMRKDLAHELVIHPPVGVSEEEFVEEGDVFLFDTEFPSLVFFAA